MKCSVEGCDRDVYARGMCTKHYQRERSRQHVAGTWQNIIRTAPSVCTVEGCDNKAKSRGLCSKHYQAHRDELIRANKWGTKKKKRVHCKREDCSRPIFKHGLCHKHFFEADANEVQQQRGEIVPTYEEWARSICELNNEQQSSARIAALIAEARQLHAKIPGAFVGDVRGA